MAEVAKTVVQRVGKELQLVLYRQLGVGRTVEEVTVDVKAAAVSWWSCCIRSSVQRLLKLVPIQEVSGGQKQIPGRGGSPEVSESMGPMA